MGMPNPKKNPGNKMLRISNDLYHGEDRDTRSKYERGKDRVKRLLIAVLISFIALFAVLIVLQMRGGQA